MLCECHDDLGLHKRLDLHAVCPVGELLLVAELRADLFGEFNVLVFRIFELELLRYISCQR